MGMRTRNRYGTTARTAGLLTVAGVALTACGGGGDAAGGDGGGDVTLRFSWWGSDQRTANTEEVIAAFEEEHPGITIEPEYSDFQGYWDKLATQTAGGDAADIIQMDLAYLREYAERGALLDITEVETEQIGDMLLEQGRSDGAQYGIPTGFASVAMIANASAFEQAGVELPDDTTWTWDDYAQVTQEIADSGDEMHGSMAPFEPVAGLQVWLRQHGADVTDDAGDLAMSSEDLVSYFEHLDQLAQDGTFPEASVIEEDRSAGVEQSLIATGGVGLIYGWSNLYPTVVGHAADDLELLRYPSSTGSAADNGMWHRASMFLSGSAETDHPEEVQEFIDFFVNSEASGLANLTDRGLPANAEVREAVLEELDGPEAEAAQFLEGIASEVSDPAPVPPQGAGELEDIMHRYQAELLFDRLTPEEAGEQAFAEIESAVG